MSKISITDQDGTILMTAGREPLTDGAADWLAGGGTLTTDCPLVMGGQGHDLDGAEDAAWLMVGLAVCVVGAAIGLASLLVWPA